MKMYMRLGAAIVAASMVTGCATITRGSKEKFYVNSTPDGADVEMTNGLRCRTPCKLKMDRKSDITVHIAKPGYQSQDVRVQGKVKAGGVAGGVLGNALIGGVIGLGVDASTGAMLDLKPNPVEVTLVPIDATVAVPAADAPVAAPAGPDAAAAPTPPAATPTPPPATPVTPAAEASPKN